LRLARLSRILAVALALTLALVASAAASSVASSYGGVRGPASEYRYDLAPTCTTSPTKVAFPAATGGEEPPSVSSGPAGAALQAFSAAEDAAANPLTDTTYSQKVLDQMAQGDHHAFPDSVDGLANQSHVTTEIDADGTPYTHVRIPGGYGSNEGVFHYIFGDNGVVNHRLFEPGG